MGRNTGSSGLASSTFDLTGVSLQGCTDKRGPAQPRMYQLHSDRHSARGNPVPRRSEGARAAGRAADGTDSRRLGVFCSEIELLKAAESNDGTKYVLGTPLKLGAGQNAEPHLLSGWS